MLLKIAVNGLFMTAVILSQQSFNFMNVEPKQIPTVLFAVFSFFQLFNAFNARELNGHSIFKHLLHNRLMLLIVSFTAVMQVVIIQFGGSVFGTLALPLTVWLKVMGMAASVLVVSEICSLIARSVKRGG